MTIHKSADSLLSTTSKFVDYRGFLNQCIVLLVISTGRIVLENIQNKGLEMKFILLKAMFNSRYIESITFLSFFSILIFMIDQLGEKFKMPTKYRWFVQVSALSLFIMIPVWHINSLTERNQFVHPFSAVLTLSCVAMFFLKFVSFCLREPRRSGESMKQLSAYFLYFLAAPTLVFEYEYPRTSKIRFYFVLRRIVELVFLCTLSMLIAERWIYPIIDTDPIGMWDIQTKPFAVVLKLLKLALPNHVLWIIFFYLFFHSFMNLTAELLKFGDREFYLDWWNASCPNEFWRKWNIPVHRFAHLHVYRPLLNLIGSRYLAGILVFFMSAVGHEYVASVALRVSGSYMFIGLMSQPFLDYLMRACIYSGKNYPINSRRKYIGNILLWIAIIFGQPITAMMYVNDYRLRSRSSVALL
ncbi:hypothetical protein GJ496_010075 [Pomphorhynchus laevis]|nr:hypothetical protein GJ496_010075 [Pomphorhynchus laevis]